MPPTGSDQEREVLLVEMQLTMSGHPLVPGIKMCVSCQRIADLGKGAVAQLRDATKCERDPTRAEQLKSMALQLDEILQHLLRHSLVRRLLKNGAQLPEVHGGWAIVGSPPLRSLFLRDVEITNEMEERK